MSVVRGFENHVDQSGLRSKAELMKKDFVVTKPGCYVVFLSLLVFLYWDFLYSLIENTTKCQRINQIKIHL